MKQFKIYFAVLAIVVTSHAQGQEAKLHLRDFTPQHRTETFLVQGEPDITKAKVRNAVNMKGIRSAHWNEQSGLLTIQYYPKIIGIQTIRKLFMTEVNDSEKTMKAACRKDCCG